MRASDTSKRERVHATEVSFMNQDAYHHTTATDKMPAPVLLKPNGAPIFPEELQQTSKKQQPPSNWEKDEETGRWLQRTVKRRDAEPETAQRTVQAKTLKMATNVNQTNIQVVG